MENEAHVVVQGISLAAWQTQINDLVQEMQRVGRVGYGSRELSLTITKLQEAGHWLQNLPPLPMVTEGELPPGARVR